MSESESDTVNILEQVKEEKKKKKKNKKNKKKEKEGEEIQKSITEIERDLEMANRDVIKEDLKMREFGLDLLHDAGVPLRPIGTRDEIRKIRRVVMKSFFIDLIIFSVGCIIAEILTVSWIILISLFLLKIDILNALILASGMGVIILVCSASYATARFITRCMYTNRSIPSLQSEGTFAANRIKVLGKYSKI